MIEGKGLSAAHGDSFRTWRGSPSTFAECGKLGVSVAGSLLQKARRIEVTANGPAPAGGTSAAYPFTVRNPVPSITSVEPAEANVGTSEITITLLGTGFFEDTEVFASEVQRELRHMVKGKIQIHLTAADLASPGTYEITAVNQAPRPAACQTAYCLL
ncbi:MAG: hypothetical protein MZV70_59665 [Desulfobacterales bacterium]|nr:hypothetical protein [Desulfobacterales bacterium]